jgi:hypothetical protein
MNEQDLRDCFAMFALLRMSFGNEDLDLDGSNRYLRGAKQCYLIADAMLEARSKTPDIGITAVKPKRRSKDEEETN